MDQLLYTSAIDAEPLHRYRKGGYHPITLGDCLKNGRYKVLHKLGWGGYSTVWAARDQSEKAYVAVKVSISKRESDRGNRELQVMKELASIQPRSQHVMRMLDNFDLEGPNGTHKCLVFELLGPSIPDTIYARCRDGRLPGKLAKVIAKQALLGLDTLHQQKIGHGDIHTRNLAFTMPCMDDIPAGEFIEMLGKPEIGHVRRSDGKALEPGIPEYIVRPASSSYRTNSWSSSYPIKIIDFGESFLPTSVPRTLHTPLPVRAPEVIFRDRLDYHVDLWSMGCMLFELFVGQPPFDSFLITPTILVGQMREMASDALPERWQDSYKTMDDRIIGEISGPALQEWLEEMYFDGERNEDLTKEDIVRLGQIIGRLLRFEPSTRASAREILNDPWFRE
ncbi:CMGC/SRPK protein kinase [Lipomyces kononenkoae]|uniref:CMGC/SRPK protein kinase n=1 Tax=Lipomyces kononenkoae TaxID=34357 RepID=A0ACC3STI5_LIPKO